jgi:hypothetical protein
VSGFLLLWNALVIGVAIIAVAAILAHWLVRRPRPSASRQLGPVREDPINGTVSRAPLSVGSTGAVIGASEDPDYFGFSKRVGAGVSVDSLGWTGFVTGGTPGSADMARAWEYEDDLFLAKSQRPPPKSSSRASRRRRSTVGAAVGAPKAAR